MRKVTIIANLKDIFFRHSNMIVLFSRRSIGNLTEEHWFLKFLGFHYLHSHKSSTGKVAFQTSDMPHLRFWLLEKKWRHAQCVVGSKHGVTKRHGVSQLVFHLRDCVELKGQKAMWSLHELLACRLRMGDQVFLFLWVSQRVVAFGIH